MSLCRLAYSVRNAVGKSGNKRGVQCSPPAMPAMMEPLTFRAMSCMRAGTAGEGLSLELNKGTVMAH